MNYRKRCSSHFKRVKERTVREAFEKVKEWRALFEEGLQLDGGEPKRFTLQQAAEYVGIPKKTLEDYNQLLKKASEIQPIEDFYDKKMGFVRRMVKSGQFKFAGMDGSDEENCEQEEIESDGNCMEQEQPPTAESENGWEQYINLENHTLYQYQYVEDFNVQINVPALNQPPSKFKTADSWENESLGSDIDTDDEELNQSQ